MNASFFKSTIENINPVKLMRDIIRVIRDALAIANDFLHLQIVDQIIDCINVILGDTQYDPTFFTL